MERQDALGLDVESTPAAAPRVRRPVNGGWVLMVAAGLVAAVANYAVLTADVASVQVSRVVAAAPAGTAVADLVVEQVELAVEDARPLGLLTPDALAAADGTVTTTALAEGALLRQGDLRVPAGEGRSAMSIPVEVARAAGGLIAVGDRVDVIAHDEAGAGYVVRDVEVLAVAAPGGGVGQSAAPAITLAVDGDEALALAAAVQAGPVDVVRLPGTGR